MPWTRRTWSLLSSGVSRVDRMTGPNSSAPTIKAQLRPRTGVSMHLALVPGLLAILVLMSLAFAASANAAEPVTNQNDSGPGSLRQAIFTAKPGGGPVDIPPGTYRLNSGQLRIGTDLVLQSTAGAGATTIQSAGPFRVLCIIGGNVTLDGLTIHGGHRLA